MTEKELREALKEVKEYCNNQPDCSACTFRSKVRFGGIVFDKCDYTDDILVYPEGYEDELESL